MLEILPKFKNVPELTSHNEFVCVPGCVLKLLLGTGYENDYKWSSLQVHHNTYSNYYTIGENNL